MSLTDEERKAVRDEGIIAALRDKSATECPYQEDDERHTLWIDGYHVAEPQLETQTTNQSHESDASGP